MRCYDKNGGTTDLQDAINGCRLGGRAEPFALFLRAAVDIEVFLEPRKFGEGRPSSGYRESIGATTTLVKTGKNDL